jgi:hypothetical protein
MSISASSPLFPALSMLAVVLAGSAIYVAQQDTKPVPTRTQAAFDTSVLEQSISNLRGEVVSLQTRLE